MNTVQQNNFNFDKCTSKDKFTSWLHFIEFPMSERYNAQYDRATINSVLLKSMMTKSSIAAHTRSKEHLPSSEWFRKMFETMSECCDVEEMLDCTIKEKIRELRRKGYLRGPVHIARYIFQT